MKTFLITLLLVPTLMAQGPLTPPAGPAPTMKTLTQIEPRTDIATVPGNANAAHRITEPGSYYLSSNLTSEANIVIEIRASGVTLDLNGFTISRPEDGNSGGAAIYLAQQNMTHIVIKNGHIFGNGIYDPDAPTDKFSGTKFVHAIARNEDGELTNCRIQHLQISGCRDGGIDLGLDKTNSVEHCSLRVIAGQGIISGMVLHSTALTCGINAITAGGTVTSSCGESVLSGHGIFSFGSITDSEGRATIGFGIQSSKNVENSSGASLTNGGGIVAETVSNSRGISEAGSAITATLVTNSFGTSSTGDGIRADIITHSRGENASGSNVGLRATIATSCTASGGVSITNRYNMP